MTLAAVSRHRKESCGLNAKFPHCSTHSPSPIFTVAFFEGVASVYEYVYTCAIECT